MNNRKKIGIITMHRPISFGSALQAYALQKKINNLGCDAELIDYQYPNAMHGFNNKGIKDIINSFISIIINALYGFPNYRKRKRFNRFHKKNYNLSRYYPTAESLAQDPPKYDLYCTGSDQVWNALFTKEDTSFLLSFVSKDSLKFSFASSFAINYVPENIKDKYSKCLSEYQYISVREQSGIKLVDELTGKTAKCVCDPTLLLARNEWDEIANQSDIVIKEPYILVFILAYSFNPYPQVQYVIDEIQRRLNKKVIFLDGRKGDLFHKNSKIIKYAGPAEFVSLIRGADYVISSSFHGVVFSSIYEKPFTAIVKRGHADSRILSYLDKVGMRDNAVFYDSTDFNVSASKPASFLDGFKSESESFLNDVLRDCLK